MTRPRDRASAAGLLPRMEARWRVKEACSGLTVAQGTAPTAEQASSEATHYAIQYAQDGPVTWWVSVGRKTVVQGRMAGSKKC